MKYFFAGRTWASLLLLALPTLGLAQSVGIGTTTPAASAALDVQATDQGLLVPRLLETQRQGIDSPATGLLVYQTDGAQPGFWYYAAAGGWTFFNPSADNLGNHTATQPLNLQANALVGTGASVGTVVGVGVRADGGLNLGQNTAGHNVFLGYQSGQANTSGSQNQFGGYQAGAANTTGYYNQFGGYQSGFSNTEGSTNQFSGYQSGFSNTTGNYNQFSGFSSGYNNTEGTRNQFSGFQAGVANTTGSQNQFSGFQSGYSNTTGDNNQFSGLRSGPNNTTGSGNQFSGFGSGYSNTTGDNNLFGGLQSGYSNTEGSQNQFSGFQSGYYNTTGNLNQFSGYQSGLNNKTGSNNYAFGYQAGPSTDGLTNAGAIGYLAQVSQSNSLVLGGTAANAVRVGIGTSAPAGGLHLTTGNAGVSSGGAGAVLSGLPGSPPYLELRGSGTGPTTTTPYIDFAEASDVDFTTRLISRSGTLQVANRTGGTVLQVNGNMTVTGTLTVNATTYSSDARFKQHVRPLAGALASVLALRGVRYEWNALGVARGGTAGAGQVGVIAQELEKVYPELVATDAQGYKSVNYAQLTPVLLEALKEQQQQLDALREQRATDHADLQTLRQQLARLLGEQPAPQASTARP